MKVFVRKEARLRHGNMLILITAFVFIVVAMAIFAISLLRLYGSHAEQKTAIEAAALACARDMSKVVINTPQFGYVGLSDSAPDGSVTAAADDYYTPVKSINTLIGTARLDYLIASQAGLDIPEWRELAEADLNNARTASQQLIDVLADAIKPGGVALDKNGNNVTPYAAAEAAYMQNQIRMSGSSNYQANSLKLSLGIVEGIGTNIPVPKPLGVDPSLNSTNTIAGNYRANINVPLGNLDFVFAAIGDSIKLIDSKKWVQASTALPYQYPTIVKAEANQLLKTNYGDKTARAVACAMPATVYDPRPAPGALTISFPDGVPDGPEKVEKPLDLYAAFLSQSQDTSDFYVADPGDYPITSSSKITAGNWPISSDPQQLASSGCKLAVYDWLRRGGTKVNVDSVVGMHQTPFIPQGPDVPWPPSTPAGNIPDGVSHIYRFDTDGVVYYQSARIKPFPWWVVSDEQNFLECYNAISNGATAFELEPVPLMIVPPVSIPLGKVEFTSRYDMFIRMYSRRYGNQSGRHGGEPMDNTLVSYCDEPRDSSGGGTFLKKLTFVGQGAAKRQPPLVGAGIGAIPLLMPQSDFAYKWELISLGGPSVDRDPGIYEKFDESGSGVRTTYDTNGSVADIRFRRVVIGKDPVSTTVNLLGSVLPIQKQQGYVGVK